jgi:SAM-dependent methyltransferase
VTRSPSVAPEWTGYARPDLDFHTFPAGARVVDVGCGTGQELRRLLAAGLDAVGVERDADALSALRRDGLPVVRGVAEHLPLGAASVDGVVCKVVVPYTDEGRAIAEWARVLRTGGLVRACYHGAGYYLQYLLAPGSPPSRRLYGARSLVNSWCYAATGRRLPGFIGDTIYQSAARLRRWYRSAGLRIEDEWVSPRYLGHPVFIYHVLSKR